MREVHIHRLCFALHLLFALPGTLDQVDHHEHAD